jgi:hypothetical protein
MADLIKEATVYYFTCDDCLKTRRQSKRRDLAEKGKCRNCRSSKRIVKGQLAAFE